MAASQTSLIGDLKGSLSLKWPNLSMALLSQPKEGKASPDFSEENCGSGVYVLIRGMLPDISLTASEKEIRSHICDVIASDKLYACCTENSFEFLEANGRNVCVPAKPSNFTWNGKAVKSLSGTGAVYVRFIVDHETFAISSSGSEFESEEESGVKIVRVDSK